jgi:polysaccharide biosynthesis protein PslA
MHPGTMSNALSMPVALGDGAVAHEGRAVHEVGSSDWVSAALQKPGHFAAKRVLDFTLSAIALIVLAPFFLAIAAAIRIESKGPVFFHQLRWGRCGEMIRIYKFRSMRADLCDVSGVAQTRENDPRVTRIGAFLRKTNLDELPQLINILLGDMSLVGPRCHVPGMLAAGKLYEELVLEYHLRHLVRPGLTGLAQVNGFRGPTDREDLARGRIAKDLDYVQNFNIFMDIKILAQTFIKEIRGGTGF